MAPRAVVLLSGGLDSTTALAIARAEGYECHALSFEYGQRHARELESARRVAAALGATAHLTLRLDLRAIGGSALTADIPVPKARAAASTSRNGASALVAKAGLTSAATRVAAGTSWCRRLTGTAAF